MADIKHGAAPAPARPGAAAAPAAAPAAAHAPARKTPPKKMILLVAAALLLAASAAGAFLVMRKPEAPAEAAGKKAQARKLPNFVDLDQFTVNLADKDQERYLQVKFSLEVASTETETTIKEMLPALRSEILLALGSRQSSDLAGREGKEALARDIVEAANKSLDHTGAEHSITAVRITQLIIQ